MRCETVKELLEAYVEGELDDSQRKELEAHLSGCELCRWELTLTKSIPHLISSLPTPSVPADIIPNTLQRLREATTVRWQWTRSFGVFVSRKWRLAVAVSLVLAIFVFGVNYQRINREPEITEAQVAAAVDDIKLALGIVSAATQDAQLATLTEGVRALDITKSKSRDAVRTLSEVQLEVFEKLRRNLAVLAQLQLKEVGKS